MGPLCWSHLPQSPSEQYRAVVFRNCAAPGHPAAASGAWDALWSGKCHALEGVQALCHSQEPPRAVGCGAAHASERAVGAVTSAQPGEMLSPAFEESAQGLCVCSAFGCQLWFASPQPQFSLACSGARLGEGAGGFWLAGSSVTHKTQMQMWRGQSVTHKQHSRCLHSSVQSQDPFSGIAGSFSQLFTLLIFLSPLL